MSKKTFHGYTIKPTFNPTPLRDLDYCGYDYERLDIDFPVEYHGCSTQDVINQITEDFWSYFLGE